MRRSRDWEGERPAPRRMRMVDAHRGVPEREPSDEPNRNRAVVPGVVRSRMAERAVPDLLPARRSAQLDRRRTVVAVCDRCRGVVLVLPSRVAPDADVLDGVCDRSCSRPYRGGRVRSGHGLRARNRGSGAPRDDRGARRRPVDRRAGDIGGRRRRARERGARFETARRAVSTISGDTRDPDLELVLTHGRAAPCGSPASRPRFSLAARSGG